MSKHTPGPWKHVVEIRENDFNTITGEPIRHTSYWIYATDEHGHEVTVSVGWGIDTPSVSAHAALIAAAPELLVSTIGFNLFLDMFEKSAFKSIMQEPQFFKIASLIREARKINNAAIAKAEGKT